MKKCFQTIQNEVLNLFISLSQKMYFALDWVVCFQFGAYFSCSTAFCILRTRVSAALRDPKLQPRCTLSAKIAHRARDQRLNIQSILWLQWYFSSLANNLIFQRKFNALFWRLFFYLKRRKKVWLGPQKKLKVVKISAVSQDPFLWGSFSIL